MAKIRYIVRTRSDSSSLDDLLSAIDSDPGLELVDTIGPPGHPHTAVVAVAPEQVAAFEQRFRTASHFIIERDRPLSPLQGSSGFPQWQERNSHA